MNNNEIFLGTNNLPEPLSKELTIKLLEKVKLGDKNARDELLIHNIKLVLHQIKKHFQNIDYYKEDLVSIGNIGLIKAIETFDLSKGFEFTTYAAKCINNEILMFLRKIKKDYSMESLEKTISGDNEGNELKLKDTIEDKSDITDKYTENELYMAIDGIVNDLPEQKREIIKLYFGFYNDTPYEQEKIASMFSITQSGVSKTISRTITLLKEELAKEGLIELSNKPIIKHKVKK